MKRVELLALVCLTAAAGGCASNRHQAAATTPSTNEPTYAPAYTTTNVAYTEDALPPGPGTDLVWPGQPGSPTWSGLAKDGSTTTGSGQNSWGQYWATGTTNSYSTTYRYTRSVSDVYRPSVDNYGGN